MLAALLSAAWSWVPSYWSDEVATLRAARLSWGELFEFVQQKDGVHLAYYGLMKLWIGAFGESEFATRSFSAIAIGVAAAGLVVLVAQLSSLPTAVMAGVIFAVLPRTTYLGIEARSFGLGLALAVWMTLALVLAIRHERWRWWVLYAALAAASIYAFLYTALLFAAHLAYLLLTRARPDVRQGYGVGGAGAGAGANILLRWLLAASAALVVSLPVLLLAVSQRGQISWLLEIDAVNVWTIIGEPVFRASGILATLAWIALIVLAFTSRTVLASTERGLFLLASAWLIMPTLGLIAADAVMGPLFASQYLAFTAPAVAILLTLSFRVWRKAIVAWLLVAALLLLAWPGYVLQRQPFAKNDGSDTAQVADYISDNAEAGDSFYLHSSGAITQRPRLALYAYPHAFEDLNDVAFEQSFVETGTFSDRTTPLEQLQPRLEGVDRLWVVTPGSGEGGADADVDGALSQAGFVAVSSFQAHRSHIRLFERD